MLGVVLGVGLMAASKDDDNGGTTLDEEDGAARRRLGQDRRWRGEEGERRALPFIGQGTFSPGPSHSPGLKVCTFSPGSSLEPGLKTL